MKAILLATTGAVAGLAVLAIGFAAGNAPPARAESAAASTDMMQVAATDTGAAAKLDRAQVEEIVRDYLLKNPEILLEVQDALEAKQKEEQRIAAEGVIKDHKDDIFNSTKEDTDLRFVLKEFPILGPDSQKASVVSMAFHKMMPQKYREFHTALLGGEGRATEDRAIKIALSLGADEAKLREHMNDPDIPDAISKTYDLANKLTITGTPSYVVGNEVIFGALGQQVLAEKIAAAKAAL